MLQLCVVLFCFLSSDVGGSGLSRSEEPVIASGSPMVTYSNKTVDNNTISTNTSVILENASINSSVVVNVTSQIPESKTVENPKLAPKGHDQQSPLNGIFSRTPSGAALRGLYVFVGLSAVVMLYIAVKLIRLRRKKMRIRKYGLIANADDVEMTPLGAEDDDEDTTLFDAHNHIGR